MPVSAIAAGYDRQVCPPQGIAGGWTARRKAVTAVVVLLCLGAGLPTTIVDEYNAQDIHNFDMAPGFPWTIVVTRQQQAAYRWIRENTPHTAVVQMDAAARGRSTWSNIPSFAERRMTAGTRHRMQRWQRTSRGS